MESKYQANNKSECLSSFTHTKDTNGYVSALQVTENCKLNFSKLESKDVMAVDTSEVSTKLNEINKTLFIENEDKDIRPNHAFLSIRIGLWDSENNSSGILLEESSSDSNVLTFALLCNKSQKLKFATSLIKELKEKEENQYKYADFRTYHVYNDNINEALVYRKDEEPDNQVNGLRELLPKKLRNCNNLSHSEAQILYTFLLEKDELITNLLLQIREKVQPKFRKKFKIKYFIITVHSRYDPCHECQEFLKLLRIRFLKTLSSNQKKHKDTLYSNKSEEKWMIPIIVISNNYRSYSKNKYFVGDQESLPYKPFPGTISVDPIKNGIFYLLSFVKNIVTYTDDKDKMIALTWPFYPDQTCKKTVTDNWKAKKGVPVSVENLSIHDSNSKKDKLTQQQRDSTNGEDRFTTVPHNRRSNGDWLSNDDMAEYDMIINAANSSPFFSDHNYSKEFEEVSNEESNEEELEEESDQKLTTSTSEEESDENSSTPEPESGDKSNEESNEEELEEESDQKLTTSTLEEESDENSSTPEPESGDESNE